MGLEKGREEGVQIGLERGREEGVQIGLEKGREEGIQLGLEKGVLVGKVHLLQQLLSEEPTPAEELLERPLEELNSLISQLQERLRSRGQ
jgi:flagellar biosynthesis/type III secretory pathway protein FliH